jgi:hypothetical protein
MLLSKLKIRQTLIIVVLLSVVGCATPQYHQAYSGPIRNQNEVVNVEIGFQLVVLEVNGVNPFSEWVKPNPFRDHILQVLPGTNTFLCTKESDNPGLAGSIAMSMMKKEIKADLKVGPKYWITFPIGDSFFDNPTDIIIVDTVTGLVIASTKESKYPIGWDYLAKQKIGQDK